MRTLIVMTVLMLLTPAAALAQRAPAWSGEGADVLPAQDVRGALIDRSVQDLADSYESRRLTGTLVGVGLGTGMGLMGGNLLSNPPTSGGLGDIILVPFYLMGGITMVAGGIGVGVSSLVGLIPTERERELARFQALSPEQRRTQGLPMLRAFAEEERSVRFVTGAITGLGGFGVGALAISEPNTSPVFLVGAGVLLGISAYSLIVPSDAERVYEQLAQDTGFTPSPRPTLTPSFDIDPNTGNTRTSLNLQMAW